MTVLCIYIYVYSCIFEFLACQVGEKNRALFVWRVFVWWCVCVCVCVCVGGWVGVCLFLSLLFVWPVFVKWACAVFRNEFHTDIFMSRL